MEKQASALGLKFRRDRSKKELHLSQSRYAAKVLERFGMASSKPVVTPMDGQIEPQDIKGELIDTVL